MLEPYCQCPKCKGFTRTSFEDSMRDIDDYVYGRLPFRVITTPLKLLKPCTRPPLGWSCSRELEHGGPCAASPVPPAPKKDHRHLYVDLVKAKAAIKPHWWNLTVCALICHVSEDGMVLVPTHDFTCVRCNTKIRGRGL